MSNEYESYIKSDKLKSVLSKYIDRIKRFYESDGYENNQSRSGDLFRDIEVVRIQIQNEISLINSELSTLESEFIHSIISDSYYFERMKRESSERRIMFLKMTWKKLLDDLEVKVNEIVIEDNNPYVDYNIRTDGRYIYEKYDSSRS